MESLEWRKGKRRTKSFSIKSVEEPLQKEEVMEKKEVSLTPEEQAIYNRVMSGDDSWQTITEEDSIDYSLSRDLFEIPDPAKKLEQNKEFKFRWITRTPARLDEIKNKPVPMRWWPVNSTQPVGGLFKSYLDPSNGCVSREDQMLVFKPWWMFEKERGIKDGLAEASFNASSLQGKDGEMKRSGRDSEVAVSAKKRSGLSSQTLREEIKSNDIVYGGEETGHEASPND